MNKRQKLVYTFAKNSFKVNQVNLEDAGTFKQHYAKIKRTCKYASNNHIRGMLRWIRQKDIFRKYVTAAARSASAK